MSGNLSKVHGIECDLRDMETLDVFADSAKWEEALAALKALREILDGKIDQKLVMKHKVWSAKETREELWIPDGVGAISFPAYALSLHKFVCALLEMSLRRDWISRRMRQVSQYLNIKRVTARRNGLLIQSGEILWPRK
jgi:hypothetical protein